jgi:hypothetical protein
MHRPQPEEFAVFYQKYIDMVGDDVINELGAQSSFFGEFLNTIPKEKENYAYAEDKWTVKEVVGHVIDTERIMTYRLTCFARKDEKEIPGFDENAYVTNAHFNDRSIDSLAKEFESLRSANMFLFRSLSEAELNRKGIANGNPVSVRALLFVIAGHLKHHCKIIIERYL